MLFTEINIQRGGKFARIVIILVLEFLGSCSFNGFPCACQPLSRTQGCLRILYSAFHPMKWKDPWSQACSPIPIAMAASLACGNWTGSQLLNASGQGLRLQHRFFLSILKHKHFPGSTILHFLFSTQDFCGFPSLWTLLRSLPSVPAVFLHATYYEICIFKDLTIFILCVIVWLSACMCICVWCALRGQKKALNPLEVELEMDVSYHVGAGNLIWILRVLNHWVFFPAPEILKLGILILSLLYKHTE